jgi:hypothetical protein
MEQEKELTFGLNAHKNDTKEEHNIERITYP